MDSHEIDSNDITQIPSAVADSLGQHQESSQVKDVGEFSGHVGVRNVASKREGLALREYKYSTSMKTTVPAGGSRTRAIKPQPGDRSRFRPWGYI